MNILVTGVAGFIGTNYVYHHLRNNPETIIIGLDNLGYAGNLINLNGLTKEENERFKFIKGDINDFNFLNKIFKEIDIEGIINFAAESHVDRSILDSRLFIKTNILGTHNLLELSNQYWNDINGINKDRKFLQISTDEVYGSLGSEGYFTESSPLDPHSPYSASKASADLIVKAYFDTYNLPINITRCSNNYGPFQFPEKLIPLMINNALEHKILPVYGDGKHIRDWLYVEDHCSAIDLVFFKGKNGEIYNVGGYNERENISIVENIIEILRSKTGDNNINKSLIRYVKDRLGHDRRYAIDSLKIQKELGWKPTIEFEKGMDITINWYLENKKWMNMITSGEYLSYYERIYSSKSTEL